MASFLHVWQVCPGFVSGDAAAAYIYPHFWALDKLIAQPSALVIWHSYNHTLFSPTPRFLHLRYILIWRFRKSRLICVAKWVSSSNHVRARLEQAVWLVLPFLGRRGAAVLTVVSTACARQSEHRGKNLGTNVRCLGHRLDSQRPLPLTCDRPRTRRKPTTTPYRTPPEKPREIGDDNREHRGKYRQLSILRPLNAHRIRRFVIPWAGTKWLAFRFGTIVTRLICLGHSPADPYWLLKMIIVGSFVVAVLAYWPSLPQWQPDR